MRIFLLMGQLRGRAGSLGPSKSTILKFSEFIVFGNIAALRWAKFGCSSALVYDASRSFADIVNVWKYQIEVYETMN